MPPRNSGGTPYVSTRFSLSMEMSRLTRDGTAEPVSRDQILRRERGQRRVNLPCSADHEHGWQPYPVDLYPCHICDDHTLHVFLSFFLPFVYFEMSLFPGICCIIAAAFSLNGEFVVRSFLPNGGFLPCGYGLKF